MICNSLFVTPRIVFRWDRWYRWYSSGFGATKWDRRVGPVGLACVCSCWGDEKTR